MTIIIILEVVMELKELRKSKMLTQRDCAKYLAIPLRTYQNYESDPSKHDSIKYRYMMEKLGQYGFIDEDHGVLTIEQIKKVCQEVFDDYEIEYCYLFGSYAKGKATDASDVDLFISSNITGLKFYGLVESLREKLHKRVDLLNQDQVKNNFELLNEILKDGIKIYG